MPRASDSEVWDGLIICTSNKDRSSQTFVYISSLPVDGDNTTESLKDIIPCLKGACWSETGGTLTQGFFKVIFKKADRWLCQNKKSKGLYPVLTMDILKNLLKRKLNSTHDVVTKS